MKIAVTLGTLRIPPTYFAIQHTNLLQLKHDIQTFALVAEISDREVLQNGITISDVVPFRGRSFRFRERLMPAYLRSLSSVVGRFQPDIIHQHFATWSTPAVSAAKHRRTPLVVTLHGADVFAALRPVSDLPLKARPMLRWHQQNVSRVFQSAELMLAVSEFLAGEAVRAGANPAKLAVHYQGIDTDFFTPASLVVATDQDRESEVVFVGGLFARKGVPDLLEASIAVSRSQPHRLRIVGAGPLKAMVEHAASEHRHIELVGGLNKAGIREVLRRAAVLVLPTQETGGWREAAGLVLLEAQACGVPVIAYKSGGTSEMMIDGETGRLVEESNRAELASTLKDFLAATPASAMEMGRRAREFVVAERSISVSAGRLDGYYHLLSGQR